MQSILFTCVIIRHFAHVVWKAQKGSQTYQSHRVGKDQSWDSNTSPQRLYDVTLPQTRASVDTSSRIGEWEASPDSSSKASLVLTRVSRSPGGPTQEHGCWQPAPPSSIYSFLWPPDRCLKYYSSNLCEPLAIPPLPVRLPRPRMGNSTLEGYCK